MSLNERVCTVLLSYEVPFIKESDFQQQLESKDDQTKIVALKALIAALVNGEQYPKLLMSVIKFCLHSENHEIKKLLLLYWEVVEKKNKEGVLLHEMILVCNALKNNVTHPNEYIRGATLSYVRKNAVLTVFTVYSAHSELIPDAPELIEQFLYAETNPAAKRNAFLMLFHCSPDKATLYLDTVINTLAGTGEAFQLIALELIRKVCRANPTLKATYIRAIHTLVNSPVHAVAYEAASTLVALTAAPIAVRAAVTAYTSLLSSESENNIKLVILQRLAALKKRNEKILQEMLMDILRTLSSPNIEIRKQTLSLALELLTQRNVEDVVQLLKKELVKADSPETQAQQQNKPTDGYRKLLVDAMHTCAVKFPHVVSTVVLLLMNYLGDDQPANALDVVYFVREIVEEYPHLRDDILLKVLENFQEIKSAEVYRVCCWIIGEYSLDPVVLSQALATLKQAVGPLPLLSAVSVNAISTVNEEEKRKDEEDAKSRPTPPASTRNKPAVLADGTYASQSAASSQPSSASALLTAPHAAMDTTNLTNLRSLLLHGDFFLAACLGATVTKLVLRFAAMSGYSGEEANKEVAAALLLLASLLRLGSIPSAPKPIDPDSQQRITLCIRALLDPQTGAAVFGDQSRAVFASMLSSERRKTSKGTTGGKEKLALVSQADDLISVRQLKGKNASDEDVVENEETDLHRALGQVTSVTSDITSTLHRVYQLTGFSDPVYAEAHLTVQSYDIVLDLLIVNQTAGILQNVSVELHTSGDLKVVERPAVHTLAAFASQRLQSTIKLTSTESGVIFGNIVYDNSSGTIKSLVVLNNIHMDIEDFISPAYVSDSAFRAMWAEFEWENKVAVATEITNLNDYLEHIRTITNMQCLTPPSTLQGDSAFLAANLYARSMFGEDALLNVSVEKQRNGKIAGYLRIRSKTQGIALSLGDKITAKQKHQK